MVTKDEDVEDIEEEEEEDSEKKDTGGNSTFKLIVIFALGITVGFIIHKILQERKGPQEKILIVNGEGQRIRHNDIITPTVKIDPSGISTTHTPKINNLRNIIRKNTPGNNVIEVNGMMIEKDTGNLVIDKNPCKYQTMVVKRDLMTGEILDIVMMDDGMIK